jgi:division protein CdvB (Snf7/Vps24/ESCRT-III family)
MRIKALKQFPISPDGIKVQMLVPGETLEVAAELGQALVKAGLVVDDAAAAVMLREVLDDIEARLDERSSGNAAAAHNKALLENGRRPVVKIKDDGDDDEPEEEPAKPKPAPRARRENKDAGSRSRRS